MALEIIKNPSLAERTTLGLGTTAEVELIVREVSDLDELGSFLATQSLRPFVIGEGSNLLAPDSHRQRRRHRRVVGGIDLRAVRHQGTHDLHMPQEAGHAEHEPGLPLVVDGGSGIESCLHIFEATGTNGFQQFHREHDFRNINMCVV